MFCDDAGVWTSGRRGLYFHQENTRLNTFLIQSELHRCEAAAFLDKQVIQD